MNDATATTGVEREPVFEKLLDRLSQGIILVDRDLNVAYANPAVERMLDADLVGAPLQDPSPDIPLRAFAQKLFDEPAPPVDRLVARDGRTFTLEGIGAGHSTVILTLADVTDTEARRHADRRFVENAAHELRTPLAVIVSTIDVLESGAKDTPARDKFLANIRVQSERLTRLALSLLVLARLQAGLENPSAEIVPVTPLLEEIAAGMAAAPGVDVVVDAPDDVAAIADGELLFRVLDNLATNAGRHTAEGSVTLRARSVANDARIEVVDTGAGIEAEDLKRVFDRFYQAGEGVKQGFGLGLAIAREAVQAMGGTLTLDSTPGVGTRACVRLPGARIVT
jgi:signal transduction histidine kinase